MTIVNSKLDAAGAATFHADALAALSMRSGLAVQNPTEQQLRISRAPLSVLATECLRAEGADVSNAPYCSAEDLIDTALSSAAGQRRVVAGGVSRGVSMDGGAYNRPGSFPNLLSNLANKILDEGLQLATPTYREWAGEIADGIKTFHAAPVVNKSQADELDLVTDGEVLKEIGLAEEMLAYIQLARYGGQIKLTPQLMANDDLGAFRDDLLGLAGAHENTLNRLCLSQLTGNPLLLDGVALFDAAGHGNLIDVGSGGAPSDTEWNDMENLVAAQTGVGGTGFVRGPLGIALVPTQHKRAALQTFALPSVNVEVKQATTDANVNIYRGLVKVVVEPELGLVSTAQWYGLMQPRGTLNATVVFGYLRGWERTGRRESWYDPNTKCWHQSMEGRFAAAAKQYRTAVRNAGS